MPIKSLHIIILSLFIFLKFSATCYSQEKEIPELNSANGKEGTLKVSTETTTVTKKKKKKKIKTKKAQKIKPYAPLAPAKAAFYSAVVPGLGQAFSGKYWKIPIVYGILGVTLYNYSYNLERYTFVRDIYKRRLAGFEDDEFFGSIDNQALINNQKRFRKNMELSLLLTTLAYVLNIIDANVTAHLQQYNINNDLTVRPAINFNNLESKPSFGLKLKYNLN